MRARHADESFYVKPEKLESFRLGRGAQSFVLLILAQKPSYGYQIRRRLEEFGFDRAEGDPAALYRLLREMESVGSIESEWDVGGTGPARRYYTLSPQGRQDLRQAVERMERAKQRAEQFLAAYGLLYPEPAAAAEADEQGRQTLEVGTAS